MAVGTLRGRAEAALEVASIHRSRIEAALAHLEGCLPRTGTELAHADYPVVASV